MTALWLMVTMIAAPQAERWEHFHLRVPDQVIAPVVGMESATMEVYVDGLLIGRHGRLPPQFQDATEGYSTFRLPPQLAKPGKVLTVSLRLWYPPGVRFRPMHSKTPTPVIHENGETPIYKRRAFGAFRGYVWSTALSIVVLLLLGLAGRTQEEHGEYSLAVVSWAMFSAYQGAMLSAFLIPWSRGSYLCTGLIGAFAGVLPLELMARLLAVRPPWWMRLGQILFVGSQLVMVTGNAAFEEPWWLTGAGALFLTAGFFPPVVALGLLRSAGKRVWGLAGLTFVLLATAAWIRFATARGTVFTASLGDVELASHTLGFTLFGLILAGLTLARFRAASREAIRLQGQMEAAKTLQEFLLAHEMTHVPGYTVQVAYRPATEVGGDFFRVLPTASGGTLVVAGDVSGKGVSAALVVSLILGALQNQNSEDPSDVLAGLNRSLCGYLEGQFATCCAAYFDPQGWVRIASAGHPLPYQSMTEVEIPSSLPLGVSEQTAYESTRIDLSPGDSLVILSDGVIEATNRGGEMFGYERTRRISENSAEEIAADAMAWGQCDDISVVRVCRTVRLHTPDPAQTGSATSVSARLARQ